MNAWTVLSILTLLGSAGLLLLGLVGAGWAFATGRSALGARLGAGAVAVVLLYGMLLLIASLTSKDETLPLTKEKYFCELDCHLAYSVESAREASRLGGGGSGPAARGKFVVLAVRTRFDEKTISASRPREAPTWPAPRTIALMDSAGNRYQPLSNLESSLATEPEGVGSPITKELRPGESYHTTLVFDVRPEATGLRLLLTDDIGVSPFLIGNERSLLHGRVFLALPPAATTATS
jgi:hypothetical protein